MRCWMKSNIRSILAATTVISGRLGQDIDAAQPILDTVVKVHSWRAPKFRYPGRESKDDFHLLIRSLPDR